MKQIIVTILFLSFAYSCKPKRTDLVLPPKSISVKNSDKSEVYVFIKYEQKDNIFTNATTTNLSQKEINDLDRILAVSIKEYNAQNKRHIDLNLYKRQYVAVKNKLGETEVWVNCFCEIDETNKWRTQIVYVDDGGNCYFNLKINLTKSSYYDFYVNGEA